MRIIISGFILLWIQLGITGISHAKPLDKRDKIEIDSIINYYSEIKATKDSDIIILNMYLNKSENIDYNSGYISILFLIMDYYHSISDFKSNSTYIEKCIEILPRLKDAEKIGDCYLRISSYYFTISDIQLALEYLYKAKNIYEQLDSDKKYTIYSYFAEYAAFKKDYARAIEYYRVPLKYYEHNFDSIGLASIYNNISFPFESIKEYDSTKFYLLEAIQLNKAKKRYNWLGRNYQNLGILYQHLGDMKQSDSCFQLSYKIGDSLNDKEIVAKTLIEQGVNLNRMNKSLEAIPLFKKALDFSNDINLRETKLSALEYLSSAHEELGNFDIALNFHKSYKELYDSIYNVNTAQLQDQMEVKYELEKTFREKEVKNKMEKLVLLIVVLSVIIGLYLVFRLYKIQKEKVKRSLAENRVLETELEKKNKEIAKFVMNLIQSNEKKMKLIKDMLDKKPLLNKENQQFIDHFIKELEEDQFNNVWKEFEVRFGEVHNEFYEKLNVHHPDLTNSERRLCAFLYLDMTTKEISSITLQSQRALEVARTRLRKKLKLTNQSASISNYLREL